jgi:hypothetical protein
MFFMENIYFLYRLDQGFGQEKICPFPLTQNPLHAYIFGSAEGAGLIRIALMKG